MTHEHGNNLPPELNAIEERLRSQRAQATTVELDELKLRAMRQARQAGTGTRLKGTLMKSRLALLTMIVVGLMMSTTGVGLAVSGNSGANSAADNAYTLGQTQGGGGDNVGGDQGGTGNSGSENSPSNGTQAVKQASASSGGGSSLPFTGFLAIPLMLGGVALLGSGLVLRRKSATE